MSGLSRPACVTLSRATGALLLIVRFIVYCRVFFFFDFRKSRIECRTGMLLWSKTFFGDPRRQPKQSFHNYQKNYRVWTLFFFRPGTRAHFCRHPQETGSGKIGREVPVSNFRAKHARGFHMCNALLCDNDLVTITTMKRYYCKIRCLPAKHRHSHIPLCGCIVHGYTYTQRPAPFGNCCGMPQETRSGRIRGERRSGTRVLADTHTKATGKLPYVWW